MGAPSTVRRSPSGAREQAGPLVPPAPCTAEGRPVGGCIPTIPSSTSNCSLRCGRNARLTFVNLRLQPVNQPLPRSARRNRSDLPLRRLIQVGTNPPIDLSQSTQILVHGYDISAASEDALDRLPQPRGGPLLLCGSDIAATGPERPVLGHFPKGKFPSQPVNPPLPRSARNNGPDLPLFRLFHVQNAPRLPKRELSQILVHGYDVSSSPSPPFSGPHPRKQTNDPSGTTTRLLPSRATGGPGRGCAWAVRGGRGASGPRLDSRLRRTFLPSRTPRLTKCNSQSRDCHIRLDFSDCTSAISKRETVQSPWKEPRSQSAYSIRPVGGRFMPVPACPRPDLQLLHHTQIPVHGYDTASVPSNLPPCEGGLCASPGSFAASPHAPLSRRSRLLRLDGRHSSPHSMAVRPTVTARCGLTRPRRRER